MKSNSAIAFLSNLLIVFLHACKKDELSQLPLITQTGEGTLGCLVNSKAVILKDGSLFNTGTFSAGYFNGNSFGMGFSSNDANTLGFVFLIDSLKFSEGKTYILSKYNTNGFASAAYYPIGSNATPIYTTNDKVTGSLTITKYSLYNGVKVLSGIFNYNAVDAKGDTVKITNGRFDFRP